MVCLSWDVNSFMLIFVLAISLPYIFYGIADLLFKTYTSNDAVNKP